MGVTDEALALTNFVALFQYRVRPSPDPQATATTEWMSEEDIKAEALKCSRKWLDIGAGEHGTLFVEVIGLDGIPNKDKNISGQNKTDSFVALIYEDCMVKTDVIDDCLSPRWLPWMQRAFVMHMAHTSSHLYVGAFDYDPGLAADHDIIGRLSIDLANLRPDTEYLLTYNLFEDSISPDREAKGTITLRLRLEFGNQKDLVLSNLGLPTDTYINVKSKKDWKMMRQILYGRYDITSFSMKNLNMYVDELKSYSQISYYLMDAIESLLFWRPQVRVLGSIWLPIHSLGVFLACIILAENPYYYPPFFCFGIAWFLFAVQHWRNNAPNPWGKTKTFSEMFMMLALGKSFKGPDSIAAHENEEASNKLDAEFAARVKAAEERAAKNQEEQMKALEEHEKLMADIGEQTADTDTSTKGGGLSINPLKPILYPIQQYLGMACEGLRLLRNVVLWDESYIAFLLSAGSLVLGIVSLFVPWAFITRWTSRIIAWGVFGPHMKLVDIFYYSKLQSSLEDDKKAMLANLAAQQEYAANLAMMARIQKEDAVKLRDLKQILYGNFMTKIPLFSTERFHDIPMHSSVATPYKKSEENATRDLPKRIDGQALVGSMIPKVSNSVNSVWSFPFPELAAHTMSNF